MVHHSLWRPTWTAESLLTDHDCVLTTRKAENRRKTGQQLLLGVAGTNGGDGEEEKGATTTQHAQKHCHPLHTPLYTANLRQTVTWVNNRRLSNDTRV